MFIKYLLKIKMKSNFCNFGQNQCLKNKCYGINFLSSIDFAYEQGLFGSQQQIRTMPLMHDKLSEYMKDNYKS